jgi:phage tail P2-like protein
MATDLLPPGSTPLERGLDAALARVGDVPIDLGALWNPATCPIHLLPWLAWALSVDNWSPAWGELQKRDAVADAIADQRRKGTRATVEAVLARFDALLTLVEWWEATPRRDPYTFQVTLELVDAEGIAGGYRATAAFALAIVTEVTKVKPVRAHFDFIQRLTMDSAAHLVAAARAAIYRRLDLDATRPPAERWEHLLQDDLGEPLTDDLGLFIDGGPA